MRNLNLVLLLFILFFCLVVLLWIVCFACVIVFSYVFCLFTFHAIFVLFLFLQFVSFYLNISIGFFCFTIIVCFCSSLHFALTQGLLFLQIDVCFHYLVLPSFYSFCIFFYYFCSSFIFFFHIFYTNSDSADSAFNIETWRNQWVLAD